MVITYFNYLWDIDGISAGSAIKGREFVAAIRRLGHTVHLEWRLPQPDGTETPQKKVREGLKRYLQNYLREPKILAANIPHLWQEYRILKAQKPDIFFPRLEYGNFSCLLLSKMLGLPTVVEADCPPTHEWKEFYAQDAFRFGELSVTLELALLNQADAVITQSNALSEHYIRQGIPAEKIHMIPNAADIRKFQPGPRDAEIEARYGLQGKTVIGWVGAGVSWTGIDVLIGVAHRILQENPEVVFMLVGSKQTMDFFGSQFDGTPYRDRVLLVGMVPHEKIPDYVSCMDIVLAPYPKFDFFYASSMKLFEYMAAGKAIVATRVGQIAEVIEEGENGFLFEPDTPEELKGNIEKLVRSPELREKFGRNARRESEREWNWDRVGEKMVAVFEKVLRERQRR